MLQERLTPQAQMLDKFMYYRAQYDLQREKPFFIVSVPLRQHGTTCTESQLKTVPITGSTMFTRKMALVIFY